MQVDVNAIVIRKRVRKSVGDLTSLMDSLRKHGQLCPILINRRSVLIAGNRRLESARRLGWENVNVIVIDKDSESEIMEIQLEENIQREALWPEELSEAVERLHKLRHVSWWRRKVRVLSRLIGRVVLRPLARKYFHLIRRHGNV